MEHHFPDRQVIGHRRVTHACKSSGVTPAIGTGRLRVGVRDPGTSRSLAAARAGILAGAPVAEEIS
jgi:hypothetical protein